MKYFLILVFFFVSFPLFAELPLDNSDAKNIPTVANLTGFLTQAETVVNGIGTPEFYKNAVLDKVKFQNLPEITQDLFYIWQAEEFSIMLYETRTAWLKILPETSDFSSSSLADLNKPTNKTYLLHCILKLETLRKSHATKYESLVDKVCEKHKDKFTPKEMIYLKQKIKNWHDTQGLVIR